MFTVKRVILALLLVSGYYAYKNNHGLDFLAKLREPAAGTAEDAFQKRKSGIMLTTEGVVEKLLADDSTGATHQRFIVRLRSGQTLLVVHNLEIAPRVDALKIGSTVKLRGEYLWSDKGGRLHWTHKDPQGRHAPGWIEVAGRRYS
jgi:hypothetical protein